MKRKAPFCESPACPFVYSDLIYHSGAVVSVFTGGAFFGAMFAGPFGDRLGRKKTILAGALVFLLGGGLQTGAKNLGYLYAGRLIAGAGYARHLVRNDDQP